MKNESLNLGFEAGEQLAGFRLERLEVFNWGTFGNNRIWSLRPQSRNALLTGDIGSGKSTLVDALTTLLVPAHRIAYNKAAGAETRERSLRSYVLGHYKSERSDSASVGRPVALRDIHSYSILLGVFRNEGYGQTVTLAQVFWFREPHGQPARQFVVAEREMTIAGDFADWGGDVARLRKQLRATGALVEDSFPPYGSQARRLLGIRSEQALELFHQTVSMKSVGNLTDFVRGHMLEPFDVGPRIQALIAHFEDLNRAHQAVLKAKHQEQLLQPIVEDCGRHQELVAAMEQLRGAREALRLYFAGEKAQLLERRLEHLDVELARQSQRIERLLREESAQRARQVQLRLDLAAHGGDRLDQLARQIAAMEDEKERRNERSVRYDELRRLLQLLPMRTAEDFLAQRQVCAQLQEAAADREATLQNELTEASVEFTRGRQDHEALLAEIASLRGRRSNIDAQQIAMRTALCEALGLKPAAMPFAGELIQVREDERDWEGAAERLLRSFGLSLLVPEDCYARVNEWVDRTHLRGRLVYYRVRDGKRSRPSELPAIHPDSLVHKLEVRSDSPFYAWLERELANRFDYACCSNQEQFRREVRALTRAGQVKGAGERHEKDDRHRIEDRSRYVLGWSNQAKIDALEGTALVMRSALSTLGARIAALQKEQASLRERSQALAKLEECRDFTELDWQALAAAIARLEDEKRALQESSDPLKALEDQLRLVEKALANATETLRQRHHEQAQAELRKEQAADLLQQARAIIDAPEAAQHGPHLALIASFRPDALGDHTLTVESCDAREQEMRRWLQDRIDAESRRIERTRERIVRAMMEFKEAFRQDTLEVDASVEAGPEYRAALERLRSDDLPRYEATFKRLLNENTINEVANFQSQLAREREQIKERIAHINESLTRIDYNPGRYVVLEAQPAADADIRDFQGELRACTEGTLTGSEDEQYSEAKFLLVKRIIERFRGREGTAELDRRWTSRVTDVRNWFYFAASERWREDDREHEHYTDSGGKSGGQKEKLAYTVLAASLAYQFGLEWGASRSRGFRFVLIDEAFGRGSDESARYGLELFRQLNLQLLVVTPLQKIHIIEPYVSTVGFVHNDGGQSSRIRNLSIEEYRSEREARGG